MPRKSAVIITGNTKYLVGNQCAADFYSDIEDYLNYVGYDVSRDPGEPETDPPPADLWVGHSRGAGRLRWAPAGTRKIALGDKNGLYHPNDNSIKDYESVPNKYHYVITTEMIEEFSKDSTTGNSVHRKALSALQDAKIYFPSEVPDDLRLVQYIHNYSALLFTPQGKRMSSLDAARFALAHTNNSCTV
jgi:hypothetical protein